MSCQQTPHRKDYLRLHITPMVSVCPIGLWICRKLRKQPRFFSQILVSFSSQIHHLETLILIVVEVCSNDRQIGAFWAQFYVAFLYQTINPNGFNPQPIYLPLLLLNLTHKRQNNDICKPERHKTKAMKEENKGGTKT